jgi:hypothetical protein
MIGFRFPTWPFGFPLEKQWWTLVGHGIQPPKGFIPVHIESFWIPRFPKCQLNHTFLLDANAWLNAKKRPWSVGAHQSFDEIRRSAQSLVHLGWSRFFWQNPVNPFNPMQNTPQYSDIYNDIYIFIFGTHIDVFAGMKSYVNDLQLWSLRHKKVLLEDEFSPVRGAFKGSVQNGLLNLCCFGRTATSRIWTNNKNPGMHQFFDTFHWWFPYMSLWFPMSILLVTSKILFIKFELFRWSNPHFNMSK